MFAQHPRLSAVLTILLGVGIAHAQQVITNSYAFPTGNRATSALLVERMQPNELRAGTQLEYNLRITNLTDAELRDVVLFEQPGQGFAFSGAEPPPTAQEGASLIWRWSAFPPRASQVLRITGNVNATGEITSCVTVQLKAAACDTLRIVQPALALVKEAPTDVTLCDPIPIRLVVTNTGSGVARNVVVNDRLPDGWLTSDGRRELAFNAGDLAAGQSRQFTATLRAERTGSFTNSATAQEAGGLTASASATTNVRKPELTVTKTCPPTRYLGRPARYEISVSNPGDAPAQNVILTDTVPPGTTFLGASEGAQFTNGRVVWNLGVIEPGQARNVAVELRIDSPGQHRNVAEARAICAEGAAECIVEGRGIPAVLLEVVDLEDPDEIGTTETYVITVTNQGSAPATNIRIRCEVQPEAQFVSSAGPVNASASGQIVTFDPFPSLPAKQRYSVQVVVRGTQVGDTRFRVEMTTDQTTSPVNETESTRFYE